jgi:signal transduction histidine kinase
LAGWRAYEKPPSKSHGKHSWQSLQKVASVFLSNQRELLRNSHRLEHRLRTELERSAPAQQLYRSLQRYPQFWGTVLYHGKNPVVWKGFSFKVDKLLQSGNKKNSKRKTQLTIEKEGNVTFWLVRIDFIINTAQEQKPKPYHLFTARRISQHNALSIGNSKNYSMLREISRGNIFNETINIAKAPGNQYSAYRTLRSLSGDSVGVVVAAAGSFQQASSHWKRMNHLWKGVYVLFCLIVIGILLYIWVDSLQPWQSLLSQTVVLGLGWFVFYQIDIAQSWLPVLLSGLHSQVLQSYQDLFNFFIDGIFFLLFGYSLRRNLKKLNFRLDSNSFFNVIIAAGVTGLANAVIIGFIFKFCYRLVYHTAIPLLTLHIFPAPEVILFYLCFGIMFLALTTIIFAFNRFLLHACEDHTKLVSGICCSGFLIGIFILSFYGFTLPFFSWAFIISLIYFGLAFLLSSITFRQVFSFYQTSPLRATALYSFIIALAGCAVIYQASTSHLDINLKKRVQRYTTKSDKQAKNITRTLLENIDQYYQSKPDSSVESRLSYLQAQVPSIVNTAIRNSTKLYFYDVQLRNARDSILINFSNNLNTPQWARKYSINRMDIVRQIENITQPGNRPIVQRPTLADAQNYQTFYRGWIPLFGPKKKIPVAWALCSVYRNYPNFSKPMRAVINEHYYQPWYYSYLMEQYQNGRLVQKNYLGIPARYPVYNVLTAAEQKRIGKNNYVFYTTRDGGYSYRNVLAKKPGGGVIKGSVILPGFQYVLFLYFQLSIILLVAGFVLTIAIRWIENRQISLFGSHERFQYRILDSFLLATVVFLILLVCITYLAAHHQNKEIVKQQVFQKLTSLVTSVRKTEGNTGGLHHHKTVPLDSLANALNVEALFYHRQAIVKSTTPQIYRQHLLPDVMPYPVYRDLYLNQMKEAFSTVKIGRRNLLVGYHSVRSTKGQPVNAVAIPTFIQSPTYNQQLLQTMSYLIILYIAVLGIFIIATVLITRKLTKPLEYIRLGLHEISRGKLDTVIPVTSRDEIGNLAKVYNQMVMRLRKLREELAETERENAWQEMAQQVAHEIKNPLTPMKLNVQHLQRQLAIGDYSVQELTERITRVTQNLTEQIDSLSNIASDFSKFSEPLDPKDFTTVSANRIIQSVANLYNQDSQIKIEVDCGASMQLILGAEDELQRVLINLVKNARESIEGEGLIRLKTFNREDSIFIEVEDSGQGISDDDKPKIFVPNFSTKSSGTGLGLAICRKVIQAHKGSISFASIKGKGTTFVIKLPLKKTNGLED